jgi:hypothetical protein
MLYGCYRYNISTSILPYRFTQYNIQVTVPDTYDRLDVVALCHMERGNLPIPDTLRLILGQRSIGIAPEVTSVSDGQKMDIKFIWQEPYLFLSIPESWHERKVVNLRIEYTLKKDLDYSSDSYSPFAFEISDSLCHINAAITRTDNWYPKIEGTHYNRLPEFKLLINVPDHFEVMASGCLKNVRENAGRKTFEWHNYQEITDRSLYFFAAQRNKLIQAYPDGFQVVLYIPQDTQDENIREISDVIHKSFRFFETKFGKVPGNEYKIMAFPYGYSGLYRSMTAPLHIFTQKIQNSDIYYPTRLLIHEVSHTWWGNVVSANTKQDYWLFEGFAKYSEVKGIKPAGGPDIEILSFSRIKMSTLPYLEYVSTILDAGMEENSFLKTVSSYYRGATFLKMIEYAMGEEEFYQALQDYTQTYQNQCVTTDEFIQLMMVHCPESMKNLFTDYLYQQDYSRYILLELETKDENTRTFIIRNTSDKLICTDVLIQDGMTTKYQKLFLPKSREKQITVRRSPLPTQKKPVIIDPDGIFPLWESGLRGPGGLVYRSNLGQVVFINVIANTPLYDAGIQDNMILLNIDGEELSDKSMEDLNKLLIRHQGTQLKLSIMESGCDSVEVVVKY